MHELYELREMLCKELKEYGGKGEMSTGTLDVVDKLTHTIKNLDKIIEADEGGYSGYYPMGRSYTDGSYRDGRSYDGSYAGRRNARRDSMGRYSGERGYSRAGLADELRTLMREAPEEHKQDFQRLIDKMER